MKLPTESIINRNFHKKEWYEVLIRDEFIDYFSKENNVFYKTVWESKILEPQFEKFKAIISCITKAAEFGKEAFEFYECVMKNKPYLNLDYSYWTDYKSPRVGSLSKIWQTIPKGENRGHYETSPELLTAEQIAVLIMYPFWSRMGGSFETTFLDDGRLKKYLLALKKKHLEETKEDSGNKE